jgi:hypothetical protein
MATHKQREKPVSRAHTPSRWRNLLAPGAIGLALVVGVATWFFLQEPTPVSLAAQYKGGPRLAVDKELIDFGPVRFERMVEARFRLRNVGDQLLHLAVNPQVKAIEGC